MSLYGHKLKPEVHIDGKTARGSRRGEIPGVHLLAVYAEKLGTALLEIPVDARINELKAALELFRLIPMAGVLVTGDAIFAQRAVSKESINLEGEYPLTVKDHQPSLKQALLDAFDAPVSHSGESVAPGRFAERHDA